MRKNKWFERAGYAGFALLSLLFSLYLTFPADALAQRLARELARASQGAWRLSYADCGLYGLSGLRLTDARLRRQDGIGEPQLLAFDRLQARLNLLPRLLGRLSLSAAAKVGDGWLEVAFSQRGEALSGELQATAFDLARLPILATALTVPVAGALSGSARLQHEGDLLKTAASGQFSWQHAGLGPATLAGFSLPKTELGNLEGELELKDGQAKLRNVKQAGGNISLRLSGGAQVRDPLSASMLDLCLQFRADPGFLSEHPKVQAALQLAEVQLRRDPEGFLHAPLVGDLNQPRLRPGLCR